MLVSVVPPGNGSVAEIWIRDICDCLPAEKLALAFISEAQIQNRTYGRSSSSSSWQLPTLPPLRSQPIQRLTFPLWSRISAKRITSEIAQFIKVEHPDILLITLHGKASILVSVEIARCISLPIVTLVWDPPEYVMRANKFDFFRLSHKLLLKDFYAILKRSRICAVMSDEMASLYQQYTNTIVLRSPVITETKPEANLNQDNRNFIIGFAGSLYASNEFQRLVEALDSVKWQIGNRKIKILIVGDGVGVKSKSPTDITYLGWRTQDEVIAILQTCDLLYLPYRMDNDFTWAARFSFPTKLSTYVTAQTPIMYHGPRDSSVTHFLGRYPIGLACHSLAINDILDTLNRLLMDEQVRERAVVSLSTAFDNEFSMYQFRSRLAQLLGIDSNSLLASPSILAD